MSSEFFTITSLYSVNNKFINGTFGRTLELAGLWDTPYNARSNSVLLIESADCILYKQLLDQFRFLGNCPPTPPLSQHFALGEK